MKKSHSKVTDVLTFTSMAVIGFTAGRVIRQATTTTQSRWVVLAIAFVVGVVVVYLIKRATTNRRNGPDGEP